MINRFEKIFYSVFAVASLGAVVAASVEPPVEFAVNLDMIRHIIHSCDEQSLQIFERM